jgi:hypothetical protein
MSTKELQLELRIIPQSWQICGICHCANECPACPERCRQENKPCLDNGCQVCVMKLIREGDTSFDNESDRLEAWVHIVISIPAFKHLKKYLIK